MRAWPPPVYDMEAEFDAPLPFVYRWCTDYSAQDGALSGDGYERRVIQRSKRRVVFEDLWWESDGWRWRRYDVTLLPPRGWRAESIGNVRDLESVYRLTELPDERTHLFLRVRRRPGPRSNGQPTKKAFENEVESMWKILGKNLEKDYRASRRRRPGTR
jgi:hypothetical protein